MKTTLLAICMAIDTSGSVVGESQAALNEGLRLLITGIQSNETTMSCVDLAIFGFGSEVRQLFFQSSEGKQQQVPLIVGDGVTAMGEGVSRCLERMKQSCDTYARLGVRHHAPWFILISDGQATDDISRAIQHFREVNWLITSIPVAVGDLAHFETLSMFSTQAIGVITLDSSDLDGFFKWLLRSIQDRVLRTCFQEAVPQHQDVRVLNNESGPLIGSIPTLQVRSAMNPCAHNASANEMDAHQLAVVEATAIFTRSSDKQSNAVAAGFIYLNGKVLVARRALSKAIAPGLFHLPGGHIELGETPIDALCREILEEFNVQIQIGKLLHVFHYSEAGQPTVGFVFAAALVDERSKLQLDPADNSELVWVNREGLEALFLDKTDHNYIAAVKGFALFEEK